MPDRTLEKIKGGAGEVTTIIRQAPEEAPAAAAPQSGFPTVGTTADNIVPPGVAFKSADFGRGLSTGVAFALPAPDLPRAGASVRALPALR